MYSKVQGEIIMLDKLTWNHNAQAYEAPYDETHTLYVSGDAWAEERTDRAHNLLAEKHPAMSLDEIIEYASEHNEDADVETCFNQAENELLDPQPWTTWAVPVDREGNRTDGESFHYTAWIEEN